MAILNAWQRIDRVLSGLPWGDGADGSATVSADPNTRATITGTATQTTGTAGSTAFANGDLVVLHQTRGTGAGQWEVNKVASGGGTTSLTFSVAHNYTYGTGAQIIKIPRYTTATVNSHSVTAWNGTTGGVEVIVGKTSITVAGSNTLTGTALGFTGAVAVGADTSAKQGEGTAGAGGTVSTSANGSGGGGGSYAGGGSAGSGGGGGNAAAGTSSTNGTAGTGGTGGSAVGSADLITMDLGGGGGGGGGWNAEVGTAGGTGGCIVLLISKSVTISGAVALNGANGVNGFAGGGGGAGGSCLVVCNATVLGTNLITATAGTGGTHISDAGTAGAGSVGRIAVHHSGTVTGTTNPSFTDVTDTTLVESTGGPKFINFI